ncbi:MAG TPA: site-specific integrase [Chitinispirillaceae bacterium]|nr:site-specific integrase [Chitinispirillaceae bacterium]
MNEYKKIQSAIDNVINALSANEYAASTIKEQQCTLKRLLEFMKEKGYTSFNEQVGTEYIYSKTNQKVNGFWGYHDRKVNRIMKPLQNLLRVLYGGNLTFFIRSHVKPFECPACFYTEYFAFQKKYKERHYANATILCNNNILHNFLEFIKQKGIQLSSDITPETVTEFLSGYTSNKPRYVSTVLYVLRNYLTFLHNCGFIEVDLASSLPHVRILRNAFIPHSWETKNVKKLLASIDRGHPKGKRDYAILLIVARLGLRVSDIRSLELSNINWSRKTVSLTAKKTKNTLELPLLDDIGWAIIDYIKNGRPKTKCRRVFVRHRAPYDAVGENESFHRELHRYMQSAGITPPAGIHCGLHSLRSTLARKMLETGAPLHVISETLGHTNINTTSIYLKIDLEGLKKCPLDPEEVFAL